MRAFKLTSAVAVGAFLLALAPSGAPAAGQHPSLKAGKLPSPTGRCSISMSAEPNVITDGEPVQLFGQLSCPSGALTASQLVTVYQRLSGKPALNKAALKTLATVTTGAGGFYSIIEPGVNADSLFYVRAAGARSPTRAVKVAPQVTLGGAPDGSQLRTGARNRTTFTGTVTPADAGAVLVLQRENATTSEEWQGIQLGVVGPGGVFSITHTFGGPGDANIRVVVRPQGQFVVRGISNTLSYEISQPENPQLTINASADPIASGQSVTLTGTVAGAVDRSVTLTTHTAGAPFVAVATTTTNASGEYKFVQSPLQSTHYRVTDGSVSSTVLFEGVRYVLTAGISASTVQSDQTVTFSGAVLPGHVGDVVYLERENTFGGGFHVADVGTVASNSKYSIPHPVFGTGKQVFRVKVPGNPINQAVSSSPFSIDVTPAPPSALRPLTPSKLPGEGQV